LVIQTAFGNALYNDSVNLIMPSSTFFEKNGTYINMEGKIQQTQKLPLIQNDKYLFEGLKISQKIKFEIYGLFHYGDNCSNFLKSFYFFNFFYFLSYNKICKSFLKISFVNYFSSTSFLKNSRILNKCSLLFSQKYENFI